MSTTTTLLPCGDVVKGPTTTKPAMCLNPEHRTWDQVDRPDRIQRREPAEVSNKAEQVTMDFLDFIEGRKGWRVTKEEPDHVIGMRTFDYGRYSAAIWVEKLGYRGRLTGSVQAHISIPFSAGPEESATGKFEEVKNWIDYKESILQIPLHIAESKTYAGALQMACELRSSVDLYTMSYIFDIHGYQENSPGQIRRELVRRCAPKLIPGATGNG